MTTTTTTTEYYVYDQSNNTNKNLIDEWGELVENYDEAKKFDSRDEAQEYADEMNEGCTVDWAAVLAEPSES